MGYLVNARDLEDLQVTALEPGGFFVSARCPLCSEKISLSLAASDVGLRLVRATDCRSGGDGPGSFQLSARFSPEETDDSSGMDVWGEIFNEGELLSVLYVWGKPRSS